MIRTPWYIVFFLVCIQYASGSPIWNHGGLHPENSVEEQDTFNCKLFIAEWREMETSKERRKILLDELLYSLKSQQLPWAELSGVYSILISDYISSDFHEVISYFLGSYFFSGENRAMMRRELSALEKNKSIYSEQYSIERHERIKIFVENTEITYWERDDK